MDATAKKAHRTAVGAALPHDSAHLHVAGTAAYTDDLPEPRDLLHLAVGMSPVAHARLRGVDLAAVLGSDGVIDACIAADIVGENNYGSIVKDDPIFAEHGQVDEVALITDRETGRPRGFGFVNMPNDDEAQAAIDAINGRDVDGRTLNVNEARPRENRGGGGGGGRRW